jgi:hypothetical protein
MVNAIQLSLKSEATGDPVICDSVTINPVIHSSADVTVRAAIRGAPVWKAARRATATT